MDTERRTHVGGVVGQPGRPHQPDRGAAALHPRHHGGPAIHIHASLYIDEHDNILHIDHSPNINDRRAALVKLRTAINRELDDYCTKAHYHPHHHDDNHYDPNVDRAARYAAVDANRDD
jgi:hypothetical protein